MLRIEHPNLPKLAEEHYTAIANYLNRDKRGYTIAKFDEKIGRYFEKESFESIVKAKPEKLEILAKKWDGLKIKESTDFTCFKGYYKHLNWYTSLKFFLKKEGTKQAYTANRLIENLGISICPYCNRNYIHNVDEEGRILSELDHFYPTSKYPFLALSFYNLIPSCKACNQAKRDKKLAINPYDKRFDFNKNAKFKVKLKDATFYYNTKGFDLTLEVKDKKSKEGRAIIHDSCILKLDKIYKHNKDIVLQQIQQHFVYNESYIDELFQQYEGSIFKNREDVVSLIFSNFITDEQLAHRPLAKLTKDINEQFDFDDR